MNLSPISQTNFSVKEGRSPGIVYDKESGLTGRGWGTKRGVPGPTEMSRKFGVDLS